MSSLGKFAPAIYRRIVAVLACATIAASPGLAAPRHAPHANRPAPPATGPAAGALVPASQAKPEAGEPPVDVTMSKTTPKGAEDRGGKATDSKSAGPIDLTRPDDGYGNHDNLRRRAARTSLIAAQRKLHAAPAVTIAPHPPTPATSEHPRNAAGAAVPAVPAALGAAKAEPVHAEPAPAFGGARNNLGLSVTNAGVANVHAPPVHVATPTPAKPPVLGINGTSLHQAGPGIGGPARDHSAIAGSSYRHK
jgi:hypothetical protein